VREIPDEEADRWVESVARDWRTAQLEPLERALCEYAVKLTCEPWAMRRADLDGLRAHGLDDTAIHEAVQVIAYFNYINRVADALHVDLEPGMPPYPPA